MPQEFHVLQCHKCKTFQVQQVKKVLKWSCKLCGEKQSVLRVYGRGSGADCRKHVQNLNTLRGQLESKQEEKIVSAKSVEDADEHCQRFQIDANEVEENIQNISSSKWDKYVEPMVNEDDDNDGREDESLYTTDRVQYNTLNKQYRKQQRDKFKQYQLYPRERNKRGRDSKWTNQTSDLNNSGGNYVESQSEFDQKSDINMKRLPQACLSSKPAKRTKWDHFLEAQNQENTIEDSQDSNIHEQAYKTVSKMEVTHKTKVVKPNFNLLDSFLDEEFEVPVSNSKTSNNIPKVVHNHSTILPDDNAAFGKPTASSSAQANDFSKTKISNRVPNKKSKWEAFTNSSPDHDSEFYIPDDNSIVFDNQNIRPEPNFDGNTLSFNRDNFHLSQSKNDIDPKYTPLLTAESQVLPLSSLKFNSKNKPSVSDGQLSNVLNPDPVAPCFKVPESNAIPAIPAKTSSQNELFQVNDFDETEFEFVI